MKLQKEAVQQSPMKVRKRKANINLAPNFKGYDPKVSAEVLTRRNERKLIRTGND